METNSYDLRFDSVNSHIIDVTLTITRPESSGQRLTMAAWIPGSYMIRDFARNLVRISASCDGERIELRKTDKQSWVCAPCTGSLVVCYEIYAFELSVRAAHVDTTHVYFNGPAVFLRVEGQDEQPCALILHRPDGGEYEHWSVATALQSFETDARGFGRYVAPNFNELIDAPVEIGVLTRECFEVEGKHHELVIYGRHQSDMRRMKVDLEEICAEHVALFGELPIRKYVFLITAVGDGYGGLEHSESTSLLCSRNDLPSVGMDQPTKEYRGFLGLCSHEYFHLWNVKRITPKKFLENGLQAEVHTRLLWVFEGFTSYYDDLALVRSGCIDTADYLALVAQTISRVFRGRGRFKQSVSESSFDAWTKFYKQDENATNVIVSYYAKGALLALALDLVLRSTSPVPCSLDDVMRTFWQRFGKATRGVDEYDMETLVQELSGLDLREFFSRYVDGTEDPPFSEIFQSVGIEMQLRARKTSEDQGGFVEEFSVQTSVNSLGLTLQGKTDATVKTVFEGGAAQVAGISARDVLIALNGIKIDPESFDGQVARLPENEACLVHLFRRDELMSFEVVPRRAPLDTCELRLNPSAPDAAIARRKNWLASNRHR